MGLFDAFKQGGALFQQNSAADMMADRRLDSGFSGPGVSYGAPAATSSPAANMRAATAPATSIQTQPFQPAPMNVGVAGPGSRGAPIVPPPTRQSRPPAAPPSVGPLPGIKTPSLSSRLFSRNETAKTREARVKKQVADKITEYRGKAASGNPLAALTLSQFDGGKYMDEQTRNSAFDGYNKHRDAWRTAATKLDRVKTPQDAKNWAVTLFSATNGEVDVRDMMSEGMAMSRVSEVKNLLGNFDKAAEEHQADADYKKEKREMGVFGKVQEIAGPDGIKRPHQWDTATNKWKPMGGTGAGQKPQWNPIISKEGVIRSSDIPIGDNTIKAPVIRLTGADGKIHLANDITHAKHRPLWSTEQVTSRRKEFGQRHKQYSQINRAYDGITNIHKRYLKNGSKLNRQDKNILGKLVQQMIEPGLQVTPGEVGAAFGSGATAMGMVEDLKGFAGGAIISDANMDGIMASAQGLFNAAKPREIELNKNTAGAAVRANMKPRNVMGFDPSRKFKGDELVAYKTYLGGVQSAWDEEKRTMGNYKMVSGNPDLLPGTEGAPPPAATPAPAATPTPPTTPTVEPIATPPTAAQPADREAQLMQTYGVNQTQAKAMDAGGHPAAPAAGDPATPFEKRMMAQNGLTLAQMRETNGAPLATLVAPPAPAANPVTARASAEIGAPADYFDIMTSAESGGRANAANPKSSARGYFQFIGSTAVKYGLSRDARKNTYSEQLDAVKRYTGDTISLYKKRGIPINNTTLYAGHFLGQSGGAKLMSMVQKTPKANAVAAFGSKVAKANKSTFYKNGRPRSVSEIYAVLDRRMKNKAGSRPTAGPMNVGVSGPGAQPLPPLGSPTNAPGGVPASPPGVMVAGAPTLPGAPPPAVAPIVQGTSAPTQAGALMPGGEEGSSTNGGDSYSMAGSAASGARDMLSMGFDDEIAGALSWITGGDYGETVKEWREAKGQASEDNPWSYAGGQAVGGIVAAVGGGAAAGAIKGAGAIASAGKAALGASTTIKGTATAGAVEGTVYGVGSGEGVEGRGTGAAVGAVSGLAAGVALGFLFQKAAPALFARMGKQKATALAVKAADGDAAAVNQLVEAGVDPQVIERTQLAKSQGIDLNRAQAEKGITSRNQADQATLERARRVGADPGHEEAFAAARRQQGQVTGAVGRIEGALPGTASTVDDAADTVQAAFRKKANRFKTKAQEGYESLDLKGTRFEAKEIGGFHKAITKSLAQTDDEIDPVVTPLAARAMGYVKELSDMAGEDEVSAVTLQALRKTQKRINQLDAGLDKNDRRALGAVKRKFDEAFSGLADSAMVRGDPSEMATLRQSNELWAKYSALAHPRNPQAADKAIAKIINDENSASDVADILWNRSQAGIKKGSEVMLRRMKKELPKKAFNDVRKATLMRAFYDQGTGEQLSNARIATNLKKMINGRGKGAMGVLFSKKDLARLSDFEETLGLLEPTTGATNPSGSGFTLLSKFAAIQRIGFFRGFVDVSAVGKKWAALDQQNLVQDLLNAPLKKSVGGTHPIYLASQGSARRGAAAYTASPDATTGESPEEKYHRLYGGG